MEACPLIIVSDGFEELHMLMTSFVDFVRE
jgi:hypothetical protein